MNGARAVAALHAAGLLRPGDAYHGQCACAPCTSGGRCSTMGDILPTIVWPEDVRTKRAQIDLEMSNLMLSAQGCDRLTPEDKIGLGSLQLQWLTVSQKPIPTFGEADAWREALGYERQVREWRDTLKKRGCTLVGPEPPEPSHDPSLPSQWISMLKVAIPAAAVIAVVVLAAPLVWEYAGTKKAARSKP